MTPEFSVLLITALTLGVGHTAIGVDHTLPFVALGRARRWSLGWTLSVTAVCGVGHVLSSVAIGYLGWVFGATLGRLAEVEATRGSLAAWLLIAFGVVYAVFGWLRMDRGDHQHVHVHVDGTIHSHGHDHPRPTERVVHQHRHGATRSIARLGGGRLVPALFVIFLLGPCEALIPLMFAESLGGDWASALLIAAAFSGATLVTMLALVALGHWGLGTLSGSAHRLERFEKHLNWSAGVAIALSGLGIQLLGI